MMIQPRAALVVIAFVLAAAAGAPAGAADIALTLDGGWYDMTNARNSATAVFGAVSNGPRNDGVPGGLTAGASLRVGVWRSFFVTGGARYFQRGGERVFVADSGSPVFGLGHPLTVRLIPVYGLLGYRFARASRLQPYVAAGFGANILQETSTVAEITDSQANTYASGHAAAGFDYGFGGVRLGAELMFTTVPNSIGIGGVSEVYGESDVGGFTIVGRLTFGR